MPDSANSMPPIAELLTWHIQSATVLQHPDIPARIKVRALQKLADTHRASLDQVSRAFPDVDFGSIEHNLAGSQLSELLSALAPDYEFAWANFELRITAPASAEQPIAQQTSPSLDVDPPAQTSAHLTISALKSIDQPLPIKIGEPNDQPTSPDAAPTSSTPIQIQLHTKPTAPTQPTKIEITTPTGPNTQPGKSPETTSQPLVTVQRARLINADDAKAASAQKQKSSERRPAAPRPLSATELQNVRSGPPIPWHLLLGAVLVVAGVAPFAFAILLNADPIGKLLFFHIATWGLLGLGELLATSTSNNDAAATFSGICGYLAPLNAIAAAYVGLSPPLLGIFAISLTTLLFLSLTKLDSTARWPILSLVILSILHLFVGEKDSADAIGLVGLGCIIGAIVLSIPESIKANLAENLPLSSLRGSHASTLFANAFAFFILLIRLASLNKTSPSALACAATFFPTGAVLLGANLSSIPQARPTANLSYSLGLIFTPLVCLFINQADLPGITPLSLAVLLSLLSLFVAWEFRPFGSAPAFGALLLSLLMLGSQSRAMADPLLMLGGAIFLATGIYLALSFIHHQKSESKDFEQNIAPLIGALLAELFAVGLLYAQVSHYASPSPGAQAFILLSIALPFLLLGGATSFRAESSASSSAAGFLSLRFAELLCAAAVIVASRSPLTALVLALLFASLRIPSLRLLLSEANARPWLNYGHGLSTLAAVVGTLTLLPATQDPLKSLALLVWTASALATTQVAGFGIAMALLALTTLKLTMPWPDSSLSFDQIADINLRLLFLTLVAWLPSLILSAQPQDPESKQDDGLTWRLRIARQAAIVYSFIGTALACAGATQVFARSITLPAPRLLILLLLPGLGFIMLARESYERRSKALGTLASLMSLAALYLALQCGGEISILADLKRHWPLALSLLSLTLWLLTLIPLPEQGNELRQSLESSALVIPGIGLLAMKRASIPFSIALLINAACYGLWAWRRARTEGAIMAGALLLFSAVMFIGPPPEAFAWLYIAPVSLMMIGFGVRWESVAGPAARALTALGVAIFLLSLGFAMISDSRGRLTEALIMTIASIAVTLAGLQIKRSELAVLGGIALAFDLLANFLWLAGSATWAWAIIIPSIGIAIIVIFSPKNEARPPSQ